MRKIPLTPFVGSFSIDKTLPITYPLSSTAPQEDAQGISYSSRFTDEEMEEVSGG